MADSVRIYTDEALSYDRLGQFVYLSGDSDEEDIKVEYTDMDGVEIDAKTGMCSWEVKLAGGESKQLNVEYSVILPVKMKIEVE